MDPQPVLTSNQKVAASLAAGFLVAAFTVVVIGAGDGAGPVGLLLVLGSFSAWGPHLVVGWSGVALTVTSLFCSHVREHVSTAALGLAGIVAAWLLFLNASEVKGFTLVTSIPFLLVLLVRVFLLLTLRRCRAA